MFLVNKASRHAPAIIIIMLTHQPL
uniref:Uncharacterized protein n=1 Tax=Anguilla anguilla TaxID=7936 RepID=A0A0E9TNC0_ANGAN